MREYRLLDVWKNSWFVIRLTYRESLPILCNHLHLLALAQNREKSNFLELRAFSLVWPAGRRAAAFGKWFV